jgi:diaminohydroxyphosphoribosylaminopyrimidine deaminase/5-amino-6-(5-phosphoribosylamino)uracil reductase
MNNFTANIGDVITPAQAMRLALNEANRCVGGLVAPNPLVGCTMVDSEHRLLAVGAHRKIGGDHAEIDALNRIPQASASFHTMRGGHIYVTLEPCAHRGRTPSCARTLAPMKPASLTYAVEDPNPLVAGKGAEIMRESGAEVFLLSEREDIDAADRVELTKASEDLAEIFLHNFRFSEPFVAVKIATSLDGVIALKSGESKWITNEESRTFAHSIRSRYDAVVIGRETFMTDDPSLNIRYPENSEFVNRVILIDPMGKSVSSLKNSNLLRVRSPANVIVVSEPHVAIPSSLGVTHVRMESNATGRFDIPLMMASLKNEGVTSMMVEGGANTIGAFFNARKVRRLHLFQAPVLLGSRFGQNWSRDFGIENMKNKIHIDAMHTQNIGLDQYITGRIRY